MRAAIPLCICLPLIAAAVTIAEEPESLLENGSFETVGSGAGTPAGWLRNTAYPATLSVLDDGAAAGELCLQVAAGPSCTAQIHRPCPAIRPGRWYRISLRVRDGPASVLVYEYGANKRVKAHTLASGTGPKGTWRQVVGFYSPIADDFRSASVALLVPAGTTAVLDDVVVEKLPELPGADGRPVRLANREVEMSISGLGRLEALTSKKTGKDYADPSAPIPVLSAVRDGVRVPVARLKKAGSTLKAQFADAALTAKLRFKARDGYFHFEVVDVSREVDALELRFPVEPQKVRDAWMPGTYGEEFAVTQMSITPNTEMLLGRYGASVAPEARWYARHGIEGGQSVLIATSADRLLDTIRRMEIDTGLPSPVLRSGAPGGTGTSDWARKSPVLRESYLFATYFRPDDVNELIRYAKIAGFGLIMLHRKSWRASAGHETIARDVFPDGLPDLVKTCDTIHAAGLRVGLHLYGPFVSQNDAYATPVPDPRLFTVEVAPLATAVDAAATDFPLESAPRLPRRASPGTHPGDLLRIGDEIVRWRELRPGTPCRLVGCERGALGTTATPHRAGTEVRSFVLGHGRLLVDPDSDLPEEMGGHLARVVNATRADLVYFDAIAGAPPGRQPERWYYVNRTLLASCAQFDHGVIVQTALGPGRQLAWHLVPRSASADGHGDLKGYLDKRLAGILQMRRTRTAADIGWYALDVHGRPDELEYVCAKALATDSSISVQAHRPMLESHPRAREVFEMLGRWERLRLSEDVPASTREKLLAKGRDFRLLDESETWSLWEAEYEQGRPILALDGQSNRWTVTNERAHAVHLALEIVREPVATTPADHAGAGSVEVVDLTDLTGFGDATDPHLLAHAQIGERKLRGEGLALRGVTTRLSSSKGEMTFAADNPTNGAGWCTTGTRLDAPLDLSGHEAIGFRVRGDGRGETLSVLLCDSQGGRARFRVTLDFEGWRFKSFPLRGSVDWSRIGYVLFELAHMPPRTQVSAGVAAVRAVSTLHAPRALRGIEVRLGGRVLQIPVSLEPGRCLTIDALGRCVAWPGGMAEGRPVEVEDGPLLLPSGPSRLEIAVDPAGDYAGDLAVRVCRTWLLGD